MPLDEIEVTGYTVDGVEYCFTEQELADLDREGEIMFLEAETDKAEQKEIEAMEAEIKAEERAIEAEIKADADAEMDYEYLSGQARRDFFNANDKADLLEDEVYDLESELDDILDELDDKDYEEVLTTNVEEMIEADILMNEADKIYNKATNEYWDADGEFVNVA